jgi:chromosome partitioning protein
MSSTQSGQSDCGPRVIVVGNYKGGSGKSTFAMHLVVALLKAGKRVASFDLDVPQQTLTRYIENRQEWARRNDLLVEVPKHAAIVDTDRSHGNGHDGDPVSLFARCLATLDDAYDFIVIDTPGNDSHLSLVAHGMADTLVTPINDSFVDLDVIVAIGAAIDSDPTPSSYARAVAAALEGRRAVCGRATDWIVFRNRLAPLTSRNHKHISRVLDLIAPQVGFRIAPGLSERVVFREYFPIGLTAFDQLDELVIGAFPSMSHLMARIEMRELIAEIGLLPPEPSTSEEAGRIVDGVQTVGLPP